MTDTEQLEIPGEGLEEEHDIEAALGSSFAWPFVPSVSGLYKWQIGPIRPQRGPHRPDVPGRSRAEEIEEYGPEYGASFDEELEALQARRPPHRLRREELRLDVDGRTPQMTASGTISYGLSTRAHWIADLAPRGRSRWIGTIWYKDGDTAVIPYTHVEIRAVGSFFASQRKARVKFSGGGAPTRTHLYRFKSPYFHPVEFEFDTVVGTDSVTSINTCDHPNRPDTLPCESLNIQTVFARAGFRVTTTTPGTVPFDGPDPNSTWSNMEMHDAMQVYWSRFANKAQWSMWTLFAAQHDMGTGLGGIMFDSIGPNHRQGTAVFNDSFISSPPAGESHPAAWVARMRFWTACHEMGHSFNLAHSWQKQHPPAWGTPWIPTPNENEARSFMNYPYYVSGGQTAFFSDFEYRFSDSELLFMRHAPARFVQMGNADWFDNHGFEQAEVSPEPSFRLELRANRSTPDFEFLEPVVLEMKLTNITAQHQLIDKSVLTASDRMTVIVKKDGKPARQWAPYARYCTAPDTVALLPDQSIYDSLFVGAGLNGWDLAEPGVYNLQMCLQLDDGDIVSEPLTLRVSPPQVYDEERAAQDFFSDEVGRILAFDGSRHFKSGNRTLEDVADRFGDRKVAVHAQIALATPKAREYKLLSLPEESAQLTTAQEAGGKFKLAKPDKDSARKTLTEVLTKNGEAVAETLGHIDYKYYVDQFSDWLDSEGDSGEAAKCQEELHHTLSERHVAGWVLDQVTERRNSYGTKAKKPAKPRQHA